MRTLLCGSLVVFSACSNLSLSLSSDRAVASANGSDAVTLTATVKDPSNAPKAGVTVHFSAPAPGVLSAASAVTDAKGEATTKLSSASAATIAVAADLKDGAAPATTQITFSPTNRLRFSTSPGNTAVGNLLRPAPVVVIEDALGQPTTATDTITVAITPGSCAAALDASSLTSVAAQGGAASFYGLKSSTAATGCTLTATSGALTPGVSASFNLQ